MSCMNFFRRFYWTTAEARRSLLGNVLHHSPQPITSGVCDQPLLHPLFPDSDEVIPDRPLAPVNRRASGPLDGERSRGRTSEIRRVYPSVLLSGAQPFSSHSAAGRTAEVRNASRAQHITAHMQPLSPSSPHLLSLSHSLELCCWLPGG